MARPTSRGSTKMRNVTPKGFSHDLARQQRVAKAKAKVRELVQQGYRLNSSRASDTYNDAVMRQGKRK